MIAAAMPAAYATLLLLRLLLWLLLSLVLLGLVLQSCALH
jgi:hypothetical protein